MDAKEHDVLAYMAFSRQHGTKLHSTNPILRLIGAVVFEQNDEWRASSRYMTVEAFAQIDKEEIDPRLCITPKAA